MPPRRVTRSVSTSVPTEGKAPTSRKKRGRSEVDGGHTEEIVEKPPSRAKKPPLATSRTRVSARSNSALKDVPETEEGEQDVDDSPPPVKRRRGTGSAAVSDDAVRQDPPPRRGRSVATSKVSTITSRARTSVVVKSEQDDEVEEMPAPTRRSTRPSIPPKLEPSNIAIPSEKPKKQSSRSGRRPVIVSDDDSIVEIPATEAASSGSKARASTSRKSNLRKGPPKPPVKQKTPSPVPLPESEPEQEPESEPEPDPDHPLGTQNENPPLVAQKQSPKKALPPPVDSDEEEPSMEDPPARIPPTQPPPPPPPEEPKGPLPRLVIHKMALVNFKSYAGRQEIGPFHKVYNSFCMF